MQDRNRVELMFRIEIQKSYWIQGREDDPKDLCLHGDVVVRIGEEECSFQDATISGAGLFLLRSLTKDHIVDGIDPSSLHTILDISIEQYKKHKKLECDLKDAKTKLADRKDIEKAKVLLMQLHGLTEDTAFQLLRKNAMSHRMTIGEMARRLLDAQQLLSNQLNSQLKDE